jgi:signal transduction histidine kinase
MYQARVTNHKLEIKDINEKKQLELLQAAIQSEEEERTRIASELHDDVGATLSSVRLFLHKIDSQSELFDETKTLLEESIQKVRNISHKLQPGILYHLGLQASLQSFAETLTKSGAINVKYISSNELPTLSDNTGLAMYRVVQELINNILKHANATIVTIKAQAVNNAIELTVEHNGKGMDNDEFNENTYKKGSLGLKNIVSRLSSVNGSINFAHNNSNYAITVTIPFNNIQS